jgi:hypothetical protein
MLLSLLLIVIVRGSGAMSIDLWLLVILTPGGFEKCVQTIRDSPADKILEIAAHYGCFIVGPPISI